jgi:hypothetical protein
MTQVRYSGVADPQRAFDELRPLVKKLGEMRIKCRPFGRDYHALSVALDALETTAFHFTRNPNFFNERRGHSS